MWDTKRIYASPPLSVDKGTTFTLSKHKVRLVLHLCSSSSFAWEQKKRQLRFLPNQVCLLAASLVCSIHKAFWNSASATVTLAPRARVLRGGARWDVQCRLVGQVFLFGLVFFQFGSWFFILSSTCVFFIVWRVFIWVFFLSRVSCSGNLI